MEEAFYEDTIGTITSREGIINVQSLMHNQLSSPKYRDMILSAWRNTDPTFNATILINNPTKIVDDVQFEFDPAEKCQVAGCQKHAFIKCTHCGKLLCHHHFMNRTCFHQPQSRSRRDTCQVDESCEQNRPKPAPVGAPIDSAALIGTTGILGATSIIIEFFKSRQQLSSTTESPDLALPCIPDVLDEDFQDSYEATTKSNVGHTTKKPKNPKRKNKRPRHG